MQYHFKIHPDVRGGYWAQCIELKDHGCRTEGDTMEELRFNMTEVLDCVLDEPQDSEVLFPDPDPTIKVGKRIVAAPVTPKIALASMVRQARVRRKMTQKQAATELGMKNVYSYQRLESSKTVNPEFTTLLRLRKLFPEVSVDLAMG
ncbi:MAG TPA: type II toxin-antitoxin system HicB family antitoxin [Fibrobacteria bacterium]|jgi:antitoxin HicB|nr:type II toxin-antitoxin system HicB family antitoxin [Fibrobacteria bacterium]